MKSVSKYQELLISSHLILAFTLQIPLARFSSFCHFNRSKASCGSDRFLLSSVQFSCSVMSNSLQPHELQHARPPYPSPTAGVYPNSCPLSRWCHLTISSSVTRFSSCPQSFSASGSFPLSWLFASGGQRTGTSVSAPVLPMNIQDWFLLGLTCLISLLSIIVSYKILEAQGLLWCLIRLTFILAAPPPTKPHIQRPPHDSHWPRGHLHTKDREGGSSHLPGFLSKASVHIPSCPLASTGSQAHDLATERVGNECLVFSGSMMRSDHHQQEEGAEEGLLNKQPRVLETQTKDSVEHRCRILRGVHTHFIEKVIW